MPAYITWLAIYVWLPLLILWALDIKLIWSHKKTLVYSSVLALIFSLPWDIWATASGLWSFPRSSVIGIYILNLPIEEFFFIIFLTMLISTMALLVRKHLDVRAIKKMVMR